MDSGPNSVDIAVSFSAISWRASSQGMGMNRASLVLPLAPVRRRGWRRRAGEYSRSRYLATFPQRKPRVTGWAGLPRSFEPCPATSTSIRREQASGQSSAQTEWWVLACISDCINTGDLGVAYISKDSRLAPPIGGFFFQF